jgi:hypothetical protein
MPRHTKKTKTKTKSRFGDERDVDFESAKTSPFQNETRARRGSVLELPMDLPPPSSSSVSTPTTTTTTSTTQNKIRIQRQPTMSPSAGAGAGAGGAKAAVRNVAGEKGSAAEEYAEYARTGIHRLPRDANVASHYHEYYSEDATQAVKDRKAREAAELARAQSTLSYKIKSAVNKLFGRGNAFGKTSKKTGKRKTYRKKKARHGFQAYHNTDF